LVGAYIGDCCYYFNLIFGLILKTIITYLRHWYFLLLATILCLVAYARAAYYFKYKAVIDLQLPHPELLTVTEKRRLKHYFFYGTTYLKITFCILSGRMLQKEERQSFSNLNALAFFFDDLVDTFQEKDSNKILWQNNPEDYGKIADDRGLALHFLGNLYHSLPSAHLEEFKSYMHTVFNVETAGRQQKESHFSTDELLHITAEKGGYSVLMFRRVLQHKLSEAERDALFQFGFLIQFCDDIFDVWFDLQDGITTLPLTLVQQNKIEELMQLFENQVDTTHAAFKKTHYAKHNIYTSLAVTHFIVTLTRVCLKQLLGAKQKLGHVPLDNRSIMVLDMEKWGNRWRTVWYLLRAK
jgi:hypothetical protein